MVGAQLSLDPIKLVRLQNRADPREWNGKRDLIGMSRPGALDRYGITTRAEDEEEDCLGLVSVPLKLKLGINLCIRMRFGKKVGLTWTVHVELVMTTLNFWYWS